MKKIILTLAAAFGILVATAGTEVQASPKVDKKSHVSQQGGSHKSFGGMKSFHHNGKDYRFHHYDRYYHGWSRYCWFPSYHCYGYFCPQERCWYYYSNSYSCYMPVSYITVFTPTPCTAPVGVAQTAPTPVPLPPENLNVNVNTNVNNNANANAVVLPGGIPALPGGAVAIPSGVTPPPMPGIPK
jgi:hypothetical protein